MKNRDKRLTQPHVAGLTPCLLVCVAAKKLLGDVGAGVAAGFMDDSNSTTYLVDAHDASCMRAIVLVWMPCFHRLGFIRACIFVRVVLSVHPASHLVTPPVHSCTHACCLSRRWRCRMCRPIRPWRTSRKRTRRCALSLYILGHGSIFLLHLSRIQPMSVTRICIHVAGIIRRWRISPST